MREIKFRAWNGEMIYPDNRLIGGLKSYDILQRFSNIMQFTGLLDKNGKEIYEGDILRFTDKWEWYKGNYAIKMMAANSDELKKLKDKYEAEPYEDRLVEDLRDEWLNSTEIQTYWKIIGNIYENKNLIK